MTALPSLSLLAVTLAAAALALTATGAGGSPPQDEPAPAPPPFARFALTELAERRAGSGRSYLSFLERGSLSTGLYVLPAGGVDGQSPHGQDEVYLVLAGRARFTAGEQVVDVAKGDVLFVAAGLEHRFHDIAEDLELLVFFSKAEPTAGASGGKADGGGDDDGR